MFQKEDFAKTTIYLVSHLYFLDAPKKSRKRASWIDVLN